MRDLSGRAILPDFPLIIFLVGQQIFMWLDTLSHIVNGFDVNSSLRISYYRMLLGKKPIYRSYVTNTTTI